MNKAELIAQQLASGESWANVIGLEVNPYGVSSYRPLNKAELIASQLVSGNQNRETWSKVIFNVLDYISSHESNHTDGLQRAINEANSWIDSGAKGLRNFPLSKLYRGGVVLLPPGVLNIDVGKIVMKTGVVIRGSGVYSTRINPIGSGGFVFGRDNVEEWLACIGYEDFTISPTDEHFAFTTKYDNPPAAGGIDFTLTSQAYINRVNILNIAGTGIRMQECYDTFLNQVEIIFVGTDENTPGFGMYPGVAKPGGRDASIIDVTNAIHIDQIRIENCPGGLQIDGTKNVNKLLREIQIQELKIENSPSVIRHCTGVTLSAGNINAVLDETKPSFTIGGPTADTRGVTFNHFTYFSGGQNKRWIFDVVGVSTYDFKVNGGSVINIKNFLTANATNVPGGDSVLPIEISHLSAVNCGTPFIQAKTRLRVNHCSFYKMNLGDYVIKAGDYAKVTHCDFTIADKCISMGSSGFFEHNTFNTITGVAHYINGAGNVIEKPTYIGTVTKKYEYSLPQLQFVNYPSEQFTSAAPGCYNQLINIPCGVNNTYGAVTAIPNKWQYAMIPHIQLWGTFASETVTYKVEAIYDDGTSAYIEKALSGALVANWLTIEEIAPLIPTRLRIVGMNLSAKSNTTNAVSLATCRVWIIMNMH
ncbi:hypothetical protein [Paenibacillus kobensis]|uniref:hypothetical protein n=1 Tax=Paenibacillus kobensis TaxID=59841 RepID=UPI000FD6D27F|nr:hypothetical protein [Paenibacillus kobensis]